MPPGAPGRLRCRRGASTVAHSPRPGSDQVSGCRYREGAPANRGCIGRLVDRAESPGRGQPTSRARTKAAVRVSRHERRAQPSHPGAGGPRPFRRHQREVARRQTTGGHGDQRRPLRPAPVLHVRAARSSISGAADSRGSSRAPARCPPAGVGHRRTRGGNDPRRKQTTPPPPAAPPPERGPPSESHHRGSAAAPPPRHQSGVAGSARRRGPEHQLYVATHRAQLPAGQPGDVLTRQLHPPGRQISEPYEAAPEGGLAAAGLPITPRVSPARSTAGS